MPKRAKKGRIEIDREICKGCCLCISVCPQKNITISKKLNEKGYYPAESLDETREVKTCLGCAMCATICPDVAIEVYRE